MSVGTTLRRFLCTMSKNIRAALMYCSMVLLLKSRFCMLSLMESSIYWLSSKSVLSAVSMRTTSTLYITARSTCSSTRSCSRLITSCILNNTSLISCSFIDFASFKLLKGRKNAIIPLSNSAAVEASWRVVYRYFFVHFTSHFLEKYIDLMRIKVYNESISNVSSVP